jgi:RNA polymerase sigma-70 factor (ECF subfamily)
MPSDEQVLRSELLVVRWQRGDRSAFPAIVEMWERPLFFYLRRLTRSEADTWDLLQEVWLRAFRSIGSLRDPRSLPAFLYRTARNTAISRLRIREIQDKEPRALEQDLESNADAIGTFDNAEQVHHALDQLPLVQREALTLFFLQDLSLDKMAIVLGVPLGTVKSRIHYAKAAIRGILRKGDDHVGP